MADKILVVDDEKEIADLVALYLENEKERKAAGICLSGPIFLSVLFYLGGAY